MSTWYPQCWVKLFIRPEEYDPPPMAPDLPFEKQDPVLNAGYLPVQHVIIPTECSVSLRSFRLGDEARVTIPYEHLPIDPRGVRSIAIHIYMGSLTPDEFAQVQGPLGGRGKRVLLPEVDPVTGRSNEVFRGFVDNMDVSLGEDNVFEMQARDITGFFIDAELPVPAVHGIPVDTPIDEVIRAIIDGDPKAYALPADVLASQNVSTENLPGLRSKVNRSRRKIAVWGKRIKGLTTLLASQIPHSVASTQAEVARLNKLISAEQAKIVGREKALKTAEVVAAWPTRIGLPGARGIRVVNETGDDPMPAIGSVKATWADSKKTVKKSARQGGANEKVSYWDFITDLCVGCGYICFFRTPRISENGLVPATELVISTPRTYYDTTPIKGLKNPFEQAADFVEKKAKEFFGVEDGARDVHLFRAGDNVDELRMSRSFAGDNVPKHIRVRAESAATGQPINIVYPPIPQTKNRRATGRAAGGQGDRIEIQEWLLNDSIPGEDPEALLTRMAKGIFEQLNKGEMEVTIETDTLAARPSNRNTGRVDMLELRAGDPVEIGVLSTQTLTENNTYITEFGKVEQLPDEVRIQQLVEANGLPPFLATQIVQADRNKKLQKIFRIREVSLDFNAEDGFAFSIDAIAYLDARTGLEENP